MNPSEVISEIPVELWKKAHDRERLRNEIIHDITQLTPIRSDLHFEGQVWSVKNKIDEFAKLSI